MAKFAWTKARTEASELFAARDLSVNEIAQKVGVDRTTLWEWRKNPEFTGRVEELTEEYRREIRRIGIADKERRLNALNDRWKRLQRVIEERSQDESMADVPGGKTGLVVRTWKQVGGGDNSMIVEEYSVDTATLRELREHEKQAAIEVGQWDEDTAMIAILPDFIQDIRTIAQSTTQSTG